MNDDAIQRAVLAALNRQITELKLKHPIEIGDPVYAGKEGYGITTRKGPKIGYALEDSQPIADGKHHLVKVMMII